MQPATRPPSSTTRPSSSPLPRHSAAAINTQTNVIDTVHGRILCIADIRGRLSALNDLARDVNAKAIIHTGDFGFFEANSIERINDRTLRHITMYSPLIPAAQRTHLLAPENSSTAIRATVNISLLSEFPLLLSGQIKLAVPVYTVWGACEDVTVLEKFRVGTYAIPNLHVLDEATTRCLDIGGLKLRLLGLGGALVYHKFFDNGDGRATIAGGQGTMWTTALQLGELVDTAQRVYDPTETRLLLTHASPGREGLLAQLALAVRADLTISAGLHFRYASSYNEFSVQPDFDGFRHKLLAAKEGFDRVWEGVKSQVDKVVDDHQRVLLDKALSVVERIPTSQPQAGPAAAAAAGDEHAWKNCWNWNLCDAAYGSLVLDIKEGRVSAELKSQGFNYAYRRTATSATPTSATSPLPTNAFQLPAKGPNPAQLERPQTGPVESSTAGPSAAAPVAPAAAVDANSASSSPQPQYDPSVSASGNATPAPGARTNGAGTPAASDREREKGKKKDKKDRKDRDRAERDAKDKETKEGQSADGKLEGATSPTSAAPKSGKETPNTSSSPPTPVPVNGTPPPVTEDPLRSPTTDGSGMRSPVSRRPARNPWTIFMRMQVSVTEEELKVFFGEAKDGIRKITLPGPIAGRIQRVAYVEFGDEAAMKAGLEKHAEKLKDTIPEVKQATDREERSEPRGRGGFRGRMARGAYVTRGFAAAGLMRGGAQRPNGEASGVSA